MEETRRSSLASQVVPNKRCHRVGYALDDKHRPKRVTVNSANNRTELAVKWERFYKRAVQAGKGQNVNPRRYAAFERKGGLSGESALKS